MKTSYQIYYEDMEHRLRENTMRTKKFIIDLKIIPYFKKKNMNEINSGVAKCADEKRIFGNVSENGQ